MKQLTFDDAVVLVSVRMPMSMKNEIVQLADTWHSSINYTVIELLRKGLDNTA